MLTSLAYILLMGLFIGGLFRKIKLPSLLGYMITGIILGPYALNLVDDSIMTNAASLRQFALVVILSRAGLSLDLEALKKVGRPAVLMCFLPACFEMAAFALLAPIFTGLSTLEALIMGSVVAAVSPAVIVPRMIKLIDEGYGVKHGIPQLVLAGASVDDVFVIVVFSAVSQMQLGLEGAVNQSGGLGFIDIASVPVSIIMGIIVGSITGLVLCKAFKMVHTRDSVKMLVMLAISFLFIQLENTLSGIIPFSGLLAIMCIGIAMKNSYEVLASRVQSKYNKLWVAAELILFTLVGASVDPEYLAKAGLMLIILLFAGLVFRMFGVLACLVRTKLLPKERVFTMIAYTPKATVQAGIGAVPLAMGLSCGQIVLTMSVLAIIITAPLGAFVIDLVYDKLLEK